MTVTQCVSVTVFAVTRPFAETEANWLSAGLIDQRIAVPYRLAGTTAACSCSLPPEQRLVCASSSGASMP